MSLPDAATSQYLLCANPAKYHITQSFAKETCKHILHQPGGFFNIVGQIGYHLTDFLGTAFGDIGYFFMTMIGHGFIDGILESGAMLALFGFVRDLSLAILVLSLIAVLVRGLVRATAGNPAALRELIVGVGILLAAAIGVATNLLYTIPLDVISLAPTLAGGIWSAGIHNMFVGIWKTTSVGATSYGVALGAIVLSMFVASAGLDVVLAAILFLIILLMGFYVILAIGSVIAAAFGMMILPIALALRPFKRGAQWLASSIDLIVGGVIAQSLAVLVLLFAMAIVLAPFSQTHPTPISLLAAMVMAVVFLASPRLIFRHLSGLAGQFHQGLSSHISTFDAVDQATAKAQQGLRKRLLPSQQEDSNAGEGAAAGAATAGVLESAANRATDAASAATAGAGVAGAEAAESATTHNDADVSPHASDDNAEPDVHDAHASGADIPTSPQADDTVQPPPTPLDESRAEPDAGNASNPEDKYWASLDDTNTRAPDEPLPNQEPPGSPGTPPTPPRTPGTPHSSSGPTHTPSQNQEPPRPVSRQRQSREAAERLERQLSQLRDQENRGSSSSSRPTPPPQRPPEPGQRSPESGHRPPEPEQVDPDDEDPQQQ